MTDTEILKDVTYRVLENGAADATGTSLMTSMFSISQMLASMNQRQWRFLKESGCIVQFETIPAPASQQTYTMGNDYIATVRLSYAENDGNRYALQRVDSWEIDNGSPEWNYSAGDPVVWNESTLPTREFNIAPLPINSGSLSHLYVAVTAALTGAGVALTIPDTFAWAIMWGVVADLLSSDGEALSIKLSEYAEQRFEQGVEMCRILMKGAN